MNPFAIWGRKARQAREIQQLLALKLEGERLLGARAWVLVSSYGKVMHGPSAGLYVSGLPLSAQRDILHRLISGETLAIHLMHRHRSGRYDISSLSWRDGRLVMKFKDREVVV